MRILVIEDEHKIANAIKKGLEQEAYAVDVAFTGDQGSDLASTEDYDLIVLDLLLPGMSGIEICQSLRAKQIHTPILILTAKGQVNNKVEGLNAGADDYVTKPFAFEELLARVKALSRRPKKTVGSHYKVDNLVLDTLSHQVTRNGQPVALSSKEFGLLEYLMRHANMTLAKERIIEHVWDYNADVLPNTVEVYIGYLRNKVDRKFPSQPALIHTVRGFGYRVGGKA